MKQETRIPFVDCRCGIETGSRIVNGAAVTTVGVGCGIGEKLAILHNQTYGTLSGPSPLSQSELVKGSLETQDFLSELA